jgi:hypothetical protein
MDNVLVNNTVLAIIKAGPIDNQRCWRVMVAYGVRQSHSNARIGMLNNISWLLGLATALTSIRHSHPMLMRVTI